VILVGLIGPPRIDPSMHFRTIRAKSYPRRSARPRHPGATTVDLKVESKFACIAARRDEVGSAEGGIEIVKGELVGQVYDRKAQAPLVTVCMENVIVAHADVKQVAGRDSLRVLVVILRPRRRYLYSCRPVP